jgi:hypothetical protein
VRKIRKEKAGSYEMFKTVFVEEAVSCTQDLTGSAALNMGARP